MSIDTSAPPQKTGYLLLFRGTNWLENGLSESQIREAMDKVNEWFDGLSAAGKLVGAQPLMEERIIVSGKGGKVVTDGPFSEAKEVIGGYVLLSVTDAEEAVAIAQSNPMHEFGLTTEIRATANTCPHSHRVFSQLAEAVS